MPSFSAILLLLFLVLGSSSQDPIRVEMVTNYGTLVVQLSDETPLHRDNFIKLVQEGTYDSLLFHRVIQGFMIQAGDTKSKGADSLAVLGGNDLDYRVPAEIAPNLFHKKGALAAARTDNPERASSSTQFYLVQGKIQSDSTLNRQERRINNMLARHFGVNDPVNKPLIDSLEAVKTSSDTSLIKAVEKHLNATLESYSNFQRYSIPEEHRRVYKEIGGSPHLDQSYTVFGEIISGLEVVDAIAAVETNARNRPFSNVVILRMRIL